MSVQIFPGPRLGWAAIGIASKPEPLLAAFLRGGERKRSFSLQRAYRYFGPLLRTRPPRLVWQGGHGFRIVEGGAGGQRGGLLVRAYPPQFLEQERHGPQVIEGDMGGRITGQ